MEKAATSQDSASSGLVLQRRSGPHFHAFARFFLSAVRPWRWIYILVFIWVLFVTAAGYVLPIIQKSLINMLTERRSGGVWLLFCAAGG